MNDVDRRRVLGMAARREIFRDRFGEDYRWQHGDCDWAALTKQEGSTLAELERDGLVVLLDGSPDRYWDVTEKALEG